MKKLQLFIILVLCCFITAPLAAKSATDVLFNTAQTVKESAYSHLSADQVKSLNKLGQKLMDAGKNAKNFISNSVNALVSDTPYLGAFIYDTESFKTVIKEIEDEKQRKEAQASMETLSKTFSFTLAEKIQWQGKTLPYKVSKHRLLIVDNRILGKFNLNYSAFTFDKELTGDATIVAKRKN